jgi:hypothetical protein
VNTIQSKTFPSFCQLLILGLVSKVFDTMLSRICVQNPVEENFLKVWYLDVPVCKGELSLVECHYSNL